MLKADGVDAQRAFEIIRTVLIDHGDGHFAVFHTGFRDYFRHLDAYTAPQLHPHADTLARIQERLLAYCAHWQAHGSRYALWHYAEHLREAKRWSALCTLARDNAFRQAQTIAFPAAPDLPLRTVQTALQGAAETDDAAAMAEFMLMHARRLLAITQESPLEALWVGTLERAWKLADLYDIGRCVLWHLLLAWKLKDGWRLEEAQATIERLREKELPRLDRLHGACAAHLLMYTSDLSEVPLPALHERLLDDTALRDFCKHLAIRGNFPTALQIAQGISEVEGRARALGAIAQAQAQAGEHKAARVTFAAALQITQGPPKTRGRALTLSHIAQAQAQAGEFSVALQITQEILDGVFRAQALRAIAQAQAQAGEGEAARATFAAALQTAQEIPENMLRAPVLGTIVRAQAQTGEFSTAL